MKDLQKKAAFTLAEVLITLGIIGIPTLIANYQKQIYVVQLKKAVAVFDGALGVMSADYDCPADLSCTRVFAPGTTPLTPGRTIAKYFKVAKDCATTSDLGCMPANANRALDGSGGIFNWDEVDTSYKFITADGASFAIMNDAQNCKIASMGTPPNQCGVLVIDVNGPNKGPNFYGRDIFWTSIRNNAIIGKYGDFDESIYPNYSCRGNQWYSASYCFNTVLNEGWQMNY